MKRIFLIITHLGAIALGFALGIYMLPILTEPQGPSIVEVEKLASSSLYKAEFKRDLAGSDLLHWGEGTVSISKGAVSLMGEVSPGPDYKLYLAPEFVETEDQFLQLKRYSVQVGDIKTFDNFVVNLPESINPEDYTTVVVWCETFGEFITAAQYR
ncbi:DM13 domain-containing protein [Pontibacterium sp. N1Y112]|uniref:DM13 domain-containing protein n=1 Tax=Pontibacterium sinense TaxID=2781979 RepID=A0A8J7FGC3_9GAMM|nr:DM13 domain-containing protein [Pontibacterium sinense]MBE9399189.1 DM13 domain-containing protein [Pontibacterium sinense]